MKAKLIIEGKEFPIDILDPELEKLLKLSNKTGYERMYDSDYYFIDAYNKVVKAYDGEWDYGEDAYNNGNYYSDKVVAENNARADRLMYQLRRFAVEHRNQKLNFRDTKQSKWAIIEYYGDDCGELNVMEVAEFISPFSIYFDSEETAKLAIRTFRDELIWYFTEYKDSL